MSSTAHIDYVSAEVTILVAEEKAPREDFFDNAGQSLEKT
jgi:hypothetical protein